MPHPSMPRPPVHAHDGGLHEVPRWPDDVSGVLRPTPGEHREGRLAVSLVQWPVSQVYNQLHVRQLDLHKQWHMVFEADYTRLKP